eukprot:scaffold1878_cov258-Pinguiococcus_pyrenoidosus.AAC.30
MQESACEATQTTGLGRKRPGTGFRSPPKALKLGIDSIHLLYTLSLNPSENPRHCFATSAFQAGREVPGTTEHLRERGRKLSKLLLRN